MEACGVATAFSAMLNGLTTMSSIAMMLPTLLPAL
jgi:hypothetical protein